MSGSVEKAVVTAEEARKLVQEERQQRGRQCGDEINKILEKYRCRLEWLEVRRGGQLVDARWQVIPLE